MAFYSKDFTLGVLGGGQLGRMLIQSAVDFDVKVAVLDPAADAPCSEIAHEFTVGSFADYDRVLEFGRGKDVVTIEIEHVNTEALRQLEAEGVKVYPQPRVLEIVKDKGLQKQFYADHNIATAPFVIVENAAQIAQHPEMLPCMQKLRTGGYDGRGVTPLRSESDLANAFNAPSVLEAFVDFEMEISVIVSRNPQGEVKAFPIVDLEFNPEANLVEFLVSPGRVSEEIAQKAHQLAVRVIEAFDMVGLLAVEMFVTRNGEVLVNEVAPRPHNSGHQTIEGNRTSQYEQHLRAILGLPAGDTTALEYAVMVNLLGEKGHAGPVHYEGMETALAMSGVHPHIYGKSETKPFRKMGHVTITGSDLEETMKKARKVMETIHVIAK
ncbi:MAG: 5-(carboxyamino)imidazole ribonucleotide synthase [Flavobacteriales bacterium]|nr:5-(carboxyamino)imidazole ribonucleotide synthase [Flavobacteriales bacterium]